MTGYGVAAAALAFALLLDPMPLVAGARLAAVALPGPAAVRSAHRTPALVAAVGCALLAACLAGWPTGALLGPAFGVGGYFAADRLLRRPARSGRGTPAQDLAVAASWDLLSACLTAGLPVPTAIRAVGAGVPGEGGAALRRTADLLALGADPVAAWEHAVAHPATAALARAARRSARSGTALAEVAGSLAAEVRSAAQDEAEAYSQRAAVLIAGPLSLCFLPAFLCLGVVPVVIGLATRLAVSW